MEELKKKLDEIDKKVYEILLLLKLKDKKERKEFYSRAELAELLKCSTATISTLARNGDINRRKIGKLVRFSLKEEASERDKNN